MNLREFNIWKVLLASPGQEILVKEIAYMTNLTCRQAFSILARMEPRIELVRLQTVRGREVCAKYPGDAVSAKIMMRTVISERFGITEDMRRRVASAMGKEEWVTLNGLSRETGLGKIAVAHTLDTIPGVEQKVSQGTNLYCRTEVR